MDPGFGKPCPPNALCDDRRRAAGGNMDNTYTPGLCRPNYICDPFPNRSNGRPPMERNQYQTQYQSNAAPQGAYPMPQGRGAPNDCGLDPTNCYRNAQARAQQMARTQGRQQGGVPGGPEDGGLIDVCFMGMCMGDLFGGGGGGGLFDQQQ